MAFASFLSVFQRSSDSPAMAASSLLFGFGSSAIFVPEPSRTNA